MSAALMASLPPEKLDRILERFASVEHGLSSGATGEAFVKLSKDYAELEPAAKTARVLAGWVRRTAWP